MPILIRSALSEPLNQLPLEIGVTDFPSIFDGGFTVISSCERWLVEVVTYLKKCFIAITVVNCNRMFAIFQECMYVEYNIGSGSERLCCRHQIGTTVGC